jgi:hypothetical protein
MKIAPLPQDTSLVTLQTVLDRLSANPALATSRRRDQRSAVTFFAKLMDQSPAAIPLDLAVIRKTLDTVVPARAKVSAKRWANLRSDLAAAIDASGLRPMLKTAALKPDQAWAGLLADADAPIAHGLSRFGRWASLRRIAPEAIDITIIERFVAELQNATLVRNLGHLRRFVAKRWNALVAAKPGRGLRQVRLENNARALERIAWCTLPASLRTDVDTYLHWASKPDPLAEGRGREHSARAACD